MHSWRASHKENGLVSKGRQGCCKAAAFDGILTANKFEGTMSVEPWAPRRINLPARLEQLRERSLPFSLAYDHLVPTLAVVRGVGCEHARKLGLRS